MDILNDSGEMNALIRKKDWSQTPLGSKENWPDNLKVLVDVMLNAPVPMFIYWGQQFICLYNDCFAQILSNTDKHPNMLGKPAKEFWAEAWQTIEPAMSNLMVTKEAFKAEDIFIPILRNGKMSDAYWTYAYTPVCNANGTVDGIFMTLTETTSLVASLKALEIQDQRFKNFIREATVGIIILIGKELVVEHVNKAYAYIIGRSMPEELLHRPLFSIIPEAESVYKPILEKVMLTGEPLFLPEAPYSVYVNGEKKEGFVNVVYQPYKEKDGTITGVLALCLDITEQITARKNLEESELFSKSIFHNSPVANIVFIGQEMIIKAVNENMLEMLGRDNSIIGKPFMEAMPELKETPLIDRLRAVLKTGITYIQPEEKITLIKQGIPHVGYYNYIYKALEDVHGETYGIMVTATDVTANINIRKTLERSEQQIRDLVEGAPFPIGVYEGRELRIILANQTMLDTYGKGNNVVGRLYPELLPELKHTPILSQLDDVLTTGNPFHAKNIRVDLVIQGVPEIHYFNYSFTPVFNENGKVYAVMNTAADVTDLNVAKQVIEENERLLQTKVEERTASLEKANANLTTSNKQLEEFTFAASHDMQEPLRKVETYTSILQANFLHGFDAKGQDYIQRIIFSVQRMRKIIDDLLEYSHQTKEGHQFVKTDLNEIIKQIEADLELEIMQKQATIKKDIIPVIEAIPAQMRQLFHNLFSNALKFANPDVSLQINITCQLPGDNAKTSGLKKDNNENFIEILFSDNGIGFEQQYATHIFSLFKRLHGKHEYGGTGIGLALCKKVLENHNGFIEAFSTPGEGATFQIKLPVINGIKL